MTKFGLGNIQVNSVRVYYDEKTSTKTNETSNLLQYESQHFRCKVKITITPGETDRNWSIGLVQACDRMYLENRYGDVGSSYWEFHPLKSGRHTMVNDSDGRQYPFYSLTSSKFELKKGLVHESVVSLHYEDHFYPTVAWELPYCGGTKLTDVIRKQDFWVWLVVIRRGKKKNEELSLFDPRYDHVHVLRTMRWRYNLHMIFDPNKSIGQRLKKLYDVQEETPYVLDICKPLPLSALSPPHCNAAQSLIWYPRDLSEKLKILVPPKQIIVPWESWLTDMGQNRRLKVQKPKDCKLVGEWPMDQQMGSVIN